MLSIEDIVEIAAVFIVGFGLIDAIRHDKKPNSTSHSGGEAEENKWNPESTPALAPIAVPIAKAESCKADENKPNWTEVFAFVAAIGGLLAGVAGSYQGWIARETLHQSQRSWVVAEQVESIPPNIMVNQHYYCRIGYRVHIRNTGNSIATNLIQDSRAVRIPPTWEWLRDKVEKLRKDTVKLWSTKRPEGLPIGITLAPNQPMSPIRCPSFGDDADPTDDQIANGAFLVIGYIEYRDQFGMLHHTRFAFGPDGDSVRKWDGKSFSIYNDYQEAD